MEVISRLSLRTAPFLVRGSTVAPTLVGLRSSCPLYDRVLDRTILGYERCQ